MSVKAYSSIKNRNQSSCLNILKYCGNASENLIPCIESNEPLTKWVQQPSFKYIMYNDTDC